MPDNKNIAVIGAGGHAKVVLDILKAHKYSVTVFDDDVSKQGQLVLGSEIQPFGEFSVKSCESIIIAIGDNKTRKAKFGQLQPQCSAAVTMSSSSLVSKYATVWPGSVIFPGAIINADSVIGENVIINTAAIIEHDCVIGNHAHIAPNTTLCGGVKVGEGALVGAGVVVLPGVSIGAWATVGSGAVVTKDIDAGVTVVGNPARRI